MLLEYAILVMTETTVFKLGGDIMPSAADIVRDSINEFSRIQDWMELVKNDSPQTYNAMYKRYIELKVTLTSLGVNLDELDRIKK